MGKDERRMTPAERLREDNLAEWLKEHPEVEEAGLTAEPLPPMGRGADGLTEQLEGRESML